MSQIRFSVVRVGLYLAALVGFAEAAPLGTVFTYQGQLVQDGVPVNSLTDFEFRLWNQAADGVQILPTVIHEDVLPENGLFTVDLDFGEFAFDSEERWLQIAVRPGGEVGDFVLLVPRQRITAAPYTLGLRVPMSTTGVGNDDLFTIKHNGGAGSAGSFHKMSLGNPDPALEVSAVGGTAVLVDGGVTFANEQSGITFSDTVAPSVPMIQMFASGTLNNDRMVIAHSPNYTDYGLQYEDAVDEFHFLSNGIDVMTVDLQSRRVGIGTSEPAKKLQVGENTIPNSEGMIRLASRSGTEGSSREWDIGVPETDADSSGTGYSFVIDDISAGGGPEVIVKWGSGNVGIGTSSPAYLLDVDGRMRVREEGGLNAGIWFYQTAPGENRALVGMYDDNTVGFYGASGGSWDLLMNTTTGNVGIKTAVPQAPLHVVSSSDVAPGSGGVLVLGTTSGGNLALDNNEIMARNNGATSPLYLNNEGGNVHMAVSGGGVSIGTTTIPTGVLLAVDGKVLCEEMEVQLSGDWPDFVFAEDYPLMPLDELERNIAQNGHLPGIPSAAEVAARGLNVGQMQAQTLQKVEELTLHMIDLHKRLQALEQENRELRDRLQAPGGVR